MSGTELLKALRTVSLRTVEVAGQTIHVRGLSGAERKLLMDRAGDQNPLQPYELAGLAACTADGGRLFTDEEAQQLADVDAAAVDAIAVAVLEASGLTPKAKEDAVKN